MSAVSTDIAASLDLNQVASGSRWRSLLRFVRDQPVGTLCLVYLVLLAAAAVFAPLAAPHSPYALLGLRLQHPNSTFLLGTDNVGRDVLSRVIYGARSSLYVGFASVLLATSLGILIGLMSAYYGGVFDLLVQRGIDALMAMPTLLLALVLATVLGPSLRNSIFAIGISVMPYQVRVIRSSVLSAKQEQYVLAARTLGASHTRIMVRAVLPNVMAIIITVATLQLAGAIIAEASLSFLGLGTQPPTASWGESLSGPGRTYMETAPWLVLGPGIALAVTVLAFNLAGDALRDTLDPRLRRGR